MCEIAVIYITNGKAVNCSRLPLIVDKIAYNIG